MAGSATLTTVESSRATNEPMIAATSVSCLSRALRVGTRTTVLACATSLSRSRGARGRRSATRRPASSRRHEAASQINASTSAAIAQPGSSASSAPLIATKNR
jgi:hypothetical protein